MCEVTNDNFHQLYHQIENDLKASKFISIDTEFSGLTPLKSATIRLHTLFRIYN